MVKIAAFADKSRRVVLLFHVHAEGNIQGLAVGGNKLHTPAVGKMCAVVMHVLGDGGVYFVQYRHHLAAQGVATHLVAREVGLIKNNMWNTGAGQENGGGDPAGSGADNGYFAVQGTHDLSRIAWPSNLGWPGT